MPKEVRIDARRDFTRRGLPWLIAAAMLGFYALTLNHWLSVSSVSTVARLSGWLWAPSFDSPLYYLVTLPIRLLPAATIPLVLNCFSAICAALTLGLLARTVALLPHDRTEAQQFRERNEFFLLTVGSAWFPPVLAALMCGLQLTFWEEATNGGHDIFDLLLFAFVVWSLVEYRLDGRVWRLYASAAVVGAGIAEGPSMTGFFPLFVVAVIWVRGLAFFDMRFLQRMFLYGLAGFSLFLVFPLAEVVFGATSLTFWEAIRLSLSPQVQMLKIYFLCTLSPLTYFEDLLAPLFIALTPVLLMSIRWRFGDSSRLGWALANLMFYAIHAVFLGVCLWLAFDPPFSPREKGFGLPLYYLIALSAGYYAGYFLLVFGKRRPRRPIIPPTLLNLLNTSVVIGVWLLAILAIAGLFYKNAPLIHAANGNTLSQYTSLVIRSLPSSGAIVLSDDPERLYLTQAALSRDGRAKDYLLLDTRGLLYPQYHRFLHKISPQKWPLLIKPGQTNLLNPVGMVEMMVELGKSNELYYLHPSYGYYFEKFYLEPHGLVYGLKPLSNDTLLPPTPDKNLVAENNAFWASAETDALASVESAVTPPPLNALETFAQQELAHLNVPSEPNISAIIAGAYYSRSLNFWGVELQRADDLKDAAFYFQKALRVNPDNVVATINLQVNQALASGQPPTVESSQSSANRLGKFNSIEEAITEGGPFDDPGFCFAYGNILAEYGNIRQAVAPLERVLQFDPNYLPARIWLAHIYMLNRLPDRTLAVLNGILDQPGTLPFKGSDSARFITWRINMMKSAAYFQKNELAEGTRFLELEVSNDPTNQALLATVEQIYASRGMFSKALDIVNRGLLLAPNDPSWLYTEGYLYNQLKQYDDAFAPLNAVLAMQKDDADALFQRGDAYMGSGNLDAARADFEKLWQSQTNSPQIAFNLGDIAWRQHDTNGAVRYFEIYLAHAPTNTAQGRTVIQWMGELGGK